MCHACTIQDVFGKFETGNFNLYDNSYSDYPNLVGNYILGGLVNADPRLILDEMGIKMKWESEPISWYLEKINKMHKHDIWVLHNFPSKTKFNYQLSTKSHNTPDIYC